MPHIELPELPGILGPMAFRPETAGPLNALAETLLRGPNSLSRGERELIAAVVSDENDCWFCCASHSAFSAAQIAGGWDTVEAAKGGAPAEAVSEKLDALLVIARQVARSGRDVTTAAVEAARAAGASDVEIHDTVLIAAAFCMFNRYVDGLATVAPLEREPYDQMAGMIVTAGYEATTPSPT